ncbi:MAG: hypothetical protein H0V21_06060 [Rubrobacter sp.]|nr:hypothetical protein [Rubrobacter sp.]
MAPIPLPENADDVEDLLGVVEREGTSRGFLVRDGGEVPVYDPAALVL